MTDPATVFAASYAELEAERDLYRKQRDTLRSAIWGALALHDGGRTAQGVGVLRSAIPADYAPVGA